MNSLLKKITGNNIDASKENYSHLSILKHSTAKTSTASDSLEKRKKRRSIRFIADTIIDKLYYDSYFKTNYDIINIIRNKTSKGVLLVKSMNDNNKYICKIRNLSDDVDNEIDIHNILNHKFNNNVAFYKEYKRESDYVYFITEYIDGNDLYKCTKKKTICASNIENITIQIAKGLLFLHQNNILHNDLKLDNIMMDKNNVIKIIDFDLSKVCEKREYISSSIFGTPRYIAPESYDLNIYSIETDLWAVGVILYVIITTKFPININMPIDHSYSNLNRRNFFKHIDKEIITECIQTKSINNKFYDILTSLLNFNGTERMTLDKIINNLKSTNRY